MKKGFRFFFSLMLAAALVCGTLGCFAEGTQEWTAGSIVTFGRYPQTKEGTDETPIEWIVLEVDEENHRALLLSKYGLEAVQYDDKDTSVTWETCSLRTWLNDDFLNRAFTAEEQSAILLTDVDNSDTQGYSGWDTTGGNDTQDYVFLLSCAEANRYMNVTPEDGNNMLSRMTPTSYAVYHNEGASASRQELTADGGVTGRWWLRSPGHGQNFAAYVDNNGSLTDDFVDWEKYSVRPVMWVSLE